ncbi:MAG: RES family NAD+ phosphorylase [Gammaproteobacteria bacterium]|nr:RES family NAD+ phosphorylase [Gammaproteobacteria bacterium]
MKSIDWDVFLKKTKPLTLKGPLFRIVESQEQIASSQLVDDFDEQALLENLLEQTKPPVPQKTEKLSYLLYTPFRYPPLKYGSRFGQRYEPSLFYGSRNLSAALAETAYYRLYFWYGMEVPPKSGQLTTQHTAFTADIFTAKGLQLQQPPFVQYQQQLTDKSSYQHTQALGSAMREQGIKAFEFISARDKEGGINIALFYPQVLKSQKPTSMNAILCATSDAGVEFIGEDKHVYQFMSEYFEDDGRFPFVQA